MKFIKGLDSLRAFAVLLVIHQHWGPYDFRAVPLFGFFLQKILPTGGFAVDFFFVLSGFLISCILIDSRKTTADGSKLMLLRNFIARRSLRIFPVYFILLLILYMVNFGDVRGCIAYYVTYTSNFLFFFQSSWGSLGHTWSLAVEEQFYFIWPFVIIFTPSRFLLKVIIAFILFGTVAGLITEKTNGFYAAILPFNCFNAFAIGGLYAYARANKNDGVIIRKVLFYLLPVGLLLYILDKAGVGHIPQRLADAIIGINLIIYVVEARYGKIADVFINNKLLNNFGKISYGIYLYHYIVPPCYKMVLAAVEKKIYLPAKLHTLFHLPVAAEVIQFCFLILISYLSFKLIEVKILRLKKYFEYTDHNEIKTANTIITVRNIVTEKTPVTTF